MSNDHSRRLDQQRLDDLLRLAKKRPLTDAETGELDQLLAADEGTVASEHYLRTNYQATGQNRSWSQADLAKIAADINKEVAKQSGQMRFGMRFQQMAWAMATVVGLFGLLYLWTFNTEPQIEPSVNFEVEPTQTPLPTPTLRPNYQYVDLLTASITQPTRSELPGYTLTVLQAQEQWDDDLYLPSQMPNSWAFLGAAVHTTESGEAIFELAFMQKTGAREDLWMLSQTSAENRSIDPPMQIIYQPLEQVDEINTYEDKEVEIGEIIGRGYQYEWVDRRNPIDWIVYNTVTWQQAGQTFTLTYPAKNNFPSTSIAFTAEKLGLNLLEN
ncbi:MAG: hypothetical protein AB8G95_12075 [Anaerolineae bacterium]